jgi:hypothetical protein
MTPILIYIPTFQIGWKVDYIVEEVIRTLITIHQSAVLFINLRPPLSSFIKWIRIRMIFDNDLPQQERKVESIAENDKES